MNILFFASLREQLNSSGETWADITDINTTGHLLDRLVARGEPWSSALSNPRLLVSVNQEVVDWQAPVKLGDEVAIFPPVTGG